MAQPTIHDQAPHPKHGPSSDIDMHPIHARLARRALDYLVGLHLSPWPDGIESAEVGPVREGPAKSPRAGGGESASAGEDEGPRSRPGTNVAARETRGVGPRHAGCAAGRWW